MYVHSWPSVPADNQMQAEFHLGLVESTDAESMDTKDTALHHLYKGFEHLWILVSIGDLKPIPGDTTDCILPQFF